MASNSQPIASGVAPHVPPPIATPDQKTVFWKTFGLGVVLPILATLGIVFATYEAVEASSNIGLTYTAMLGTYSSLCVFLSLSAIALLIQKTRELYQKNEADIQKQRSEVLQGIRTLGLAILTIIGTIYASEYLPQTGLNQTAWQGSLAVAAAFAFAAVILDATHFGVDQKDKKDVWKWIQPLAIMSIAVIGVLFAATYLPNIDSGAGEQGTATLIGVTGFIAALFSIAKINANEPDQEGEWNYMKPFLILFASILATCYASEYMNQSSTFVSGTCVTIMVSGVALSIASLVRESNREHGKTKLNPALAKLEFENNTKCHIYSWLLPILFCTIGSVFATVGVNELGASHDYFALTIGGGVLGGVMSCLWACLTYLSQEEIDAKLKGITGKEIGR